MSSKGEEKLLEILKSEFPGYTIKSQVPIKIGRKTLYCDFLIPSLLLAFEFDGRQHFEHINFFHGSATNSTLKEFKERDRLKDQTLSEMGYTVVRISYKENLETGKVREKIREALGD